MRVSLHLIIYTIVVFGILKTTTFGWRFWSRSFRFASEENSQLVKALKNHVQRLAFEIGVRDVFHYEKLEEAAKYVASVFKSLGYKVEFQDYNIFNHKVSNIIVTKTGIKEPEEIIIVGAHYDTCANPGADDNASAVAGLLELAKSISNEQVNRSIKFIAFVNEEPPFFTTEQMGSWVYARAAKQKGENIKAVLILEMIGFYSDKLFSQRYPPLLGLFYPNKGNFIAVVGNLHSRWLIKEVVINFKKQTQFPIESTLAIPLVPGADFSDHWSFWKEGYSAVMLTDTAFYRNPHYHTNLDTYEKLNYNAMAEVVRALSGVLIELTK